MPTQRRIRQQSEGERSDVSNATSGSPFERTQRYRSFHAVSKTQHSNSGKIKGAAATNASPVRPPWNCGGGVAASYNKTHQSSPSATAGPAPSVRSFRSSFRRRDQNTCTWQSLWERSLALRAGGTDSSAIYKNHDEFIKAKVGMSFRQAHNIMES